MIVGVVGCIVKFICMGRGKYMKRKNDIVTQYQIINWLYNRRARWPWLGVWLWIALFPSLPDCPRLSLNGLARVEDRGTVKLIPRSFCECLKGFDNNFTIHKKKSSLLFFILTNQFSLWPSIIYASLSPSLFPLPFHLCLFFFHFTLHNNK
jgi:hypothetical protein